MNSLGAHSTVFLFKQMGILTKFIQSPKDVKILLASVFLRRASFGITSQVLTLFLVAVGISKSSIGVFMTLTLVGDTLISLVLTWYSDALGRRVVMISGCFLMIAAGLTFAQSLNFWILLIAAVIGVISTSGDETGPFKSVEEACLSHLVDNELRPYIFGTYGLLGTLGSAIGSSLCGGLVLYWSSSLGWPITRCYRAIFILYASIGVLKLTLTSLLSQSCELDQCISNADANDMSSACNTERELPPVLSPQGSEEDPLLEEGLIPDQPSTSSPSTADVLSPETRLYLPKLLVVFMLDSFGYGFMPPAWIVYYFRTVFNSSPASIGSLFFFTNLVDSISSVASAMTFHIFGPVKAILVAQVPSAFFFALIPSSKSFLVAAAFYFLFCACATMDVVPRQILLTHLIPKRDLVRALGLVNIAKTFARCIGPLFTGKIAESNRLDIAFYINGFCLILADSILGFNFAHLDRSILRSHETS